MKEQKALSKRIERLSEIESQLELATSEFTGSYDVAPPGDGIHLRDYWRILRKHLWMIAGITLLVTSLVAVYMARQPEMYVARARVQVDLENNPGVGALSKGGQVVLSTRTNDPIYFNTQPQILEGPGLLRRVVKTLDLEHNPEFRRPQIAERRSTWQSLLRMFGLGGREKVESGTKTANLDSQESVTPTSEVGDPQDAERLAPYVEALQRGLAITPVRETRLIDISYVHLDPVIATKIVNTVADVFVLSNLEKKTDSSSSEIDFLQKHIAELQSEIRNGEERIINYAKNHQIISLEGAQNTVAERLVSLNQQLMQAESERKTSEAAYQAALAPGAADALVKESAPLTASAQNAIAQLRQRRALLLVKTTEEWPEVKEIDQQIKELEKQIHDSRSDATGVLLANLKTRFQQALSREQALRVSFDQQRGETLTQNEAAIGYRILQQEVETNRNLLNGLLQRSGENAMAVAGTGNNIHVVDYAVRPRGPIGMNRLFSVFMALPIALGLGIGLAFFLEYLDDTLRTQEDVEKQLRLPALAVIPSLQSLKKRGLLPAKYVSPHLKAIGNGNGNGNGNRNGAGNVNGNDAPNAIIAKDARSPLAEAYRQLRTALLLSSVGGPPKTVLVASSLPSEGKTTTAVNLAITLVQGGATVLIIDGDMRRPRLHTIFGLTNEEGLSTILASEAPAAEVHDLVSQDEETGLHVLCSGPMPPNPADHLGSAKMQLLLTMFQSVYTHIIIDSPPLSSFTDGVLLSSMVDNVLLVVQGGKGSRDVIRRARKLLQDVGANVTGVVLNNVALRAHDYYYYHGYYKTPYNNGEPEPAKPESSLGLQ